MTKKPEDLVNTDNLDNNVEDSFSDHISGSAKNEDSTELDATESGRLKILQAELEDWKQKSLRLAADLQNLNKQHDLDIQQAKKTAKKSILVPALTFINTLNLAFTFEPQTEDEKITKFIGTLKSSLQKVIEDFKLHGVEVIVPEPGDEFNAEFMNILNPDNANLEEGVVIKQVVSCGLKVDNQLVQPASVMI